MYLIVSLLIFFIELCKIVFELMFFIQGGGGQGQRIRPTIGRDKDLTGSINQNPINSNNFSPSSIGFL